jgi:LacI family transcriptional regulator
MSKIRRVALILDSSRPYQRKIVVGVAAYARETGRWSLYVEDEPRDKLPNLRTWHGQGVITAFVEPKYVEAIRGLSIPVVGVEGGSGWYEPDSGIPYFATNNEAVAQMAAEHLIDQGFSQLAYCGMPRNRYNIWSHKRAIAFCQAAREAKRPCSIYTGRHLTTRKWIELQRGLATWLRSLKKPVGIMAANDARARHILEACHTIGARVPEEIAVIGVDNDELMCEVTDPPLSSVEQGARQLGYAAAALLDQMMSGKRVPQIENYITPERIVRRRSTDVLAMEDSDVAEAVRFIRNHTSDRIRVADILKVIGISRSTLEVRFKRIMGRTVHDEIQRAMIAQAQQLIVEGKLTLKQVAARSGFSHIQHMTTLFRQRIGQTPSAFRRSARLELSHPASESPLTE